MRVGETMEISLRVQTSLRHKDVKQQKEHTFMNQEELLSLILAMVTDRDFTRGFRQGQAAYEDDREKVTSDTDILQFLRHEIAPETFQDEAVFDQKTGMKPLALRSRYGFLAGWLLAAFTHQEGTASTNLAPLIVPLDAWRSTLQ